MNETIRILRQCRGIAFDCYGTLLQLPEGANVTRRAASMLTRARHGMVSPLVNDVTLSDALTAAGRTEEEAEETCIEAQREAASATLLPGALAAIEAAIRSGKRVAVASNLSREYAAPIRRLLPGIPTCLSFEVGSAKPNPVFYARLCILMGLDPSEIVMIGDSRRCDYDGARAAGLEAILLTSTSDAAYHLRHVGELPGILQGPGPC